VRWRGVGGGGDEIERMLKLVVLVKLVMLLMLLMMLMMSTKWILLVDVQI
jgi:hypothetical protein